MIGNDAKWGLSRIDQREALRAKRHFFPVFGAKPPDVLRLAAASGAASGNGMTSLAPARRGSASSTPAACHRMA